MYLPPSFAEHELPVLFAFMEAHPLAALVTASATDGLFATHLPVVLDRDAGTHGTLMGHLARANAHSRQLAAGVSEAMVIFTGPDAYITPEWYAAKREHGRVVPTWNYVAVHAYGTIRLRADEAFLRAHLEALTARHEAGRPRPWTPSDAPAEYIAQQLHAIVGFELEITRLEGKWKMSQNRSAADVAGVVDGLMASESPRDREVGEVVAQRQAGRSSRVK